MQNGSSKHTLRAPSNTSIALCIVVIAVLCASWILKQDAATARIKTAGAPEQKTKDAVVRTHFEEQDSDGDTVPDWEEVLWGTNPNNPDTAGTGAGDAHDIAQKQQELASSTAALSATLDPRTSADWNSISYTDQVSRLFVSNYLTLKESGAPISSDVLRQIPTKLPAYGNTHPAVSVYTLSDIRVSASSNQTTLHTYGNAVGSILSVPTGATSANELLVLKSFIQDEDPTVFETQISILLTQYDRVISKLLTLSVPQSLADKHLELVNALSAVESDLLKLRDGQNDPLLALSAITTYTKNTARRGAAFQAIRDALSAAGVTFSASEPGYLLTATGTTQ
jgi:hypothetical protein